MNENDLRAILQSDYKLWTQAETTSTADLLTKSLELPHGIGVFSLSFEGATDAGKLRNAMEIWGVSIRDAVDEAIGDEAVTARAKQAAALASPITDTDISGDRTDYIGPGKVPCEGTVYAPAQTLPTSETILNSIYGLRRRIADTKKALTQDERELRALIAFKEALHADDQTDLSTDSTETEVVSS